MRCDRLNNLVHDGVHVIAGEQVDPPAAHARVALVDARGDARIFPQQLLLGRLVHTNCIMYGCLQEEDWERQGKPKKESEA